MVFAALFWIVLTAFYSVHANFPFYYHNDEPSKVRQIKLGPDRWNLRHPPLMLMVTESVFQVSGLEREEQVIVRVGRATSAVFLAGAVTLVALVAWLRMGWVGAAATGLLTGINPLVFECARYFKEDAILLFGIAAFFLVVEVMNRRSAAAGGLLLPSALLGLTVAWCLSSKYIGVIFLPLGILSLLVLCPRGPTRRQVLGLFGAVTLAALCLLNLPLLLNFGKALAEIQTETVKLAEGDHGVGHDTPHVLFLKRIFQVIPPTSLAAIAALGLWLGVRKFRRQDFALWLLVGFQLVHLAGLCFIAKYSDRYLLPLLIFVPFLAVTGIFAWYGLLRGSPAPGSKEPGGMQFAGPLLMILLIATLAWHLPELQQRYEGFRTDSRIELQQFIRDNLPRDSRIAIDEMVHLYPFMIEDRPVERSYFVADIGAIPELRERGITHVAISYDVYWRYLKENQSAAEGRQELHDHRSGVYRTLTEQGDILFERPNTDPKPLHPGIRLVDIRRIPTDTD